MKNIDDVKKNSAETIFRRELDLLTDDAERTRRIFDRFLLYTHDLGELDISDSDQALLWLVKIAEETFLGRDQKMEQNSWDLNVYLRRVYRIFPAQNNSQFLFPETRKEILRIILKQWDVRQYDDRGREIFMFIWDTYGINNSSSYNRPIEERNIIDKLLRERLNDAESKNIEKWIKWIRREEIKSRDDIERRDIPDHLGRHFALARARFKGFRGAWWDLRYADIIDVLQLMHVSDNQLIYLEGVCRKANNFDKEVFNHVKQLGSYSFVSLSDGDKISYSFVSADNIEIYFRKKKPDTEVDCTNFYNAIFDEIVDKMTCIGLLSETRASFLEKQRVSLKLVIVDENNIKMCEKKWDVRN